MGHAGATAKSTKDAPWKMLSQRQGVGQLWQTPDVGDDRKEEEKGFDGNTTNKIIIIIK